MNTPKPGTQFALQSRILHWLMVVLLLAMQFIGVSMVASLGDYHTLVAIHRPLGIVILILAAIRLANRMCTTLPPFPPTMSRLERFMASSSEKLLYALMFAQPLVGWGMLSASHRDVRASASTANSAGQSDALRGLAPVAHGPRVSAVRDVPRPP